jgi:hypothetical protein
MAYKTISGYILTLTALLLIFSSCNDVTSPIDDSLDPVSEVTLISGSENTTIIVNRSTVSYFSIEFLNIQNNSTITNGEKEGWCIDWQKPIDASGGVYNNIKLYSTFNIEKWNSLNYLLNIKEQLKANDQEITNLELQIAVWSLRGFPEFDMNKVNLQDLPGRMHNDGLPTFSSDKVNEILQIVEDGYRDFTFSPGTKFAVIAETPADVQTVITVVQ